MKKTDLEKSKARKIEGRLAQSGIPQRFGSAVPPPDRREQRRVDQAAGLVSFATKLPGELIAALNDAARAQGVAPGELAARLLAAGLPGYHADSHSQEG
ncbi:hypothetical protein [Methylibium sp.]|uniref:hypothetical protein n=1 Tax=Methylibium sp. TaxID=2067992 RepID=UPI00286B534C|nr:hypothetical protein [Methylibium sp.]